MGAGGLLIGFSLSDSAVLPELVAGVPGAAGALPLDQTSPTPAPDRLDAWLRIEKDETVRVFTGKAEIGMGVGTAFAQIVAEELDVPFTHVAIVMGDTATTADQGGVGGSTSVAMGGKPLRNAAASARFVLVQMAATHLGVSPDQLQVKNGIVTVKGDESKNISYGALVAGGEFSNPLSVSGTGFGLNVQGAGKPKDPAMYTVVGQPIARADISHKVLGQFTYVGDFRLPGMLHGRVVRPSTAGAKLVSVDENSVKAIPGIRKVVAKDNFVGVVADTEWAAIRGAKALKVTWSASAPPFPEQNKLYEFMRSATPKATKVKLDKGDTVAALASATKKVHASYEWPFQSHASMGPGCAVADFQPDGVTTVWSGAQKPHALKQGISQLLNLPPDKIRVIWMEDSGSYGRGGFEDTAADAALLSQAVGRPVRVQWMRSDMTAWGGKGPAAVFDITGGIDSDGKVSAIQFTSRTFSGTEIIPQPNTAGNLLGGQLTGHPNDTGTNEFAEWGDMAPPYDFPNVHAVQHVLTPFCEVASPLRGAHLRDPNGPCTTFAVESFIDELAAAAGTDPIQFRLKYFSGEPRIQAVLTAAAERAGWDTRVSPRNGPNQTGKSNGAGQEIATGRGVGLGVRNGTYVATIAEVEVNRSTGAIHVKRFVCAHDCGLIINPDGLRAVISANLIQSLGRTLKEEVAFDRGSVTSVDWNTYHVARASDVPEQVDIVTLNHTELPAGGAGEPSSRATAAAIANAVFDATGVRVRRVPLTPATVKAALAAPHEA